MGSDQFKFDSGKPKISLVPPQIIRDIAAVREYGVNKYGAKESWRNVSLERYIDAYMRHNLCFMENPWAKDSESGLYHYQHSACNMAFICELMSLEEDVLRVERGEF